MVVGSQSNLIRRELAKPTTLPIELQFVPAPGGDLSDRGSAPTPGAPPPNAAIDGMPARTATARAAYIEGDFAACMKAVESPELVSTLLRSDRRDLVASLLIWRIACAVGRNAIAAAEGDARFFFGLALTPPAETYELSPEVAALLSRIEKDPKRANAIGIVDISSDAEAASLRIDGKPELCSPPCTFRLSEGTHFVALTALGVEREFRVFQVAVDSRRTVHIATNAAAPERAALQWQAEAARPDAELDSEPMARLLASALGARHILFVAPEQKRSGQVRATLIVDGKVAARVTRSAADVARVLPDLFLQARLIDRGPPIYKRAALWIPVSLGAAALVTGIAVGLVYTRPVRTEVWFGPR